MICTTCQRDPKRVNNEVSECSHVDCPHRPLAWCGGTGVPKWRKPEPEPVDKLLDDPTK